MKWYMVVKWNSPYEPEGFLSDILEEISGEVTEFKELEEDCYGVRFEVPELNRDVREDMKDLFSLIDGDISNYQIGYVMLLQHIDSDGQKYEIGEW